MKFQRLTSVVLAGVLTISTIPYNVLAASGEITADKGSSQVPAKVTAEAAQFSVTVPAILPIDVNADGAVTTADDVKIVNNSASPVKVTKVSVEAINDWQLAEFDSDFTRMRVNEKKFGLQLQTNNVQTDGTCGLNGFTAIPGNGGELPLAYDANLTTQTTAIDHLNIANVTFTIGWDDGTTSDGEDDGEQFTVTYTSDGNGTVNESSRTFKQGAYITFPDTTPLEGFTFDKWVDSTTESEVTDETIVSSDIEVKALFIPYVDEAELSKYYLFYDDTDRTGGWRVELKDDFMMALSQNTVYMDWNPGEPLPALPAVYKDKPVTSYANMFGGTFGYHKTIASLDLSNFDTRNVISMANMFSYCESLTSLNLDGFDTSNVQTMSRMFFNCKKLSHLDVSNWNTSNVTNMAELFKECNSLTALDLTKWDTRNVTAMASMFYQCRSLKQLDITNFNTDKVTNMSGMFGYSGCIDSLDFSNFNTSNVTTMSAMFSGCVINHLDITNFDTQNVETMQSMFQYSRIYTDLDLSSFDTSNVKNVDGMFYMCELHGNTYGRTQEDCNKFNSSSSKPSNVNFVVKP